jgi:hypothetical protein
VLLDGESGGVPNLGLELEVGVLPGEHRKKESR